MSGTDDRNAEDAVFEQAQIALLARLKGTCARGATAISRFRPPTPRDTLNLDPCDIRPVVA